jgi:ATP-dependent Lhr-like helicase
MLRRLEDRGEVRGGRFVSGFGGEQFALPEAADSLRAARDSHEQETVTLSGADPMNLIGILVPGERVAAIQGRSVTLRNGLVPGSDPEALLLRPARPPRVVPASAHRPWQPVPARAHPNQSRLANSSESLPLFPLTEIVEQAIDPGF